jgi:ABC-type dipeptide/oligopeptide/nickel transport system permease subunit
VSLNTRSPWVRTWQEIRGNGLAFVSFCFVVFVFLIVLFAPLLAPHDPDAVDLLAGRLLPPFFVDGGSWVHPLGTDATGRDVLSRLIYGARISIVIGAVPVFFGCLLGVPLGLISGYFGGKIDETLMRINDVLLAFPSILLALIVVAFLGQGIFNLMIAVGLANAPAFARIVRGAVLAEREREYVASAQSLGATSPRVVVKHILPNITSALIVIFTINFASALLEAAGLSFLGLGVQPPTAEWGAMLADGKNYFYDGWWMIVFPGLAIFALVMSLNILGDALRDALDPRSAKR